MFRDGGRRPKNPYSFIPSGHSSRVRPLASRRILPSLLAAVSQGLASFLQRSSLTSRKVWPSLLAAAGSAQSLAWSSCGRSSGKFRWLRERSGLVALRPLAPPEVWPSLLAAFKIDRDQTKTNLRNAVFLGNGRASISLPNPSERSLSGSVWNKNL